MDDIYSSRPDSSVVSPISLDLFDVRLLIPLIIDRFAQFFISPLFSADAVSREIRAVDSGSISPNLFRCYDSWNGWKSTVPLSFWLGNPWWTGSTFLQLLVGLI